MIFLQSAKDVEIGRLGGPCRIREGVAARKPIC
jgi:hypothetical protein